MKKQYIIKDEATRLYWGRSDKHNLWTQDIEYATRYDSENDAFHGIQWLDDDGYYEVKTIFIKE